jgi:GNAT superfamily N-acetyltransferase
MKWFIRLTELVKDWHYLIQRDGWKRALSQIRKQVFTLPYRHIRFVVVARSLLEPLPDLTPKVPVAIRPFELTDLSFVHREHLPSEAKLCAQRLERNHYGLTAWLNDEIAGYAWGCTNTTLEKVKLELEPGDVLCTDAFTVPAFRGQGIQTALSLARLRWFQELNYCRAIAYIEVGNAPSLAVWHKMGAQEIARITFTRVGPWRKTRYGE